MPEIFINGHSVMAADNQTVMEAAQANGFFIPYFCWHPKLSISGNCRICAVQVEGRSWVEIACNLPVTRGLRVLTDSDLVRAHRKATLQFVTLNHPVDCGICDKAGECSLQDYHFAYNGSPSVSAEPKVKGTKFHDLSKRIVLDNERCILCSRCVRFTHEISKSCALGIKHRGDESLLRASEDNAFDTDHYSDNVIDICPVGALLSRDFLYKARVWYLKPTPSVCPGCERGCNVNLWHRKPEWRVRALDPRQNTSIVRVTPRENPVVNGPWICNKGRDLARIFGRTRAEGAMLKGKPTELATAIAAARSLLAAAKHPVAILSSWGSNEEFAAFKAALGNRCASHLKTDWVPEPGEPVEDDLLIRRDKNPNTAGARAIFPSSVDSEPELGPETDLVLVWGEGFDFGRLPAAAKIVFLQSYLAPENGHADVFVPVSNQTERSGHYTNFQGVVSAFEPCFAKPATVAHAADVFTALAAAAEPKAEEVAP
jgi:NADH-quinone oxidoreductase subunit G